MSSHESEQTVPQGHDFALSTGPERVVRGTVVTPAGDPRGTMVFGHGFKGFKEWGAWPWMCQQWAARGWTVCRFDFSLNGVANDQGDFDEPEKFSRQTYGSDLDDWRQVSTRRDEWGVPAPGPVVLVGHSRGGFTGLLAAANLPEVVAVCSLAAPARGVRFSHDQLEAWKRDGEIPIPNFRTGVTIPLDIEVLEDFERNSSRYDLQAALESRTLPTLIVHGSGDETVPLDEGREIFDWIPHTKKQLVELPGTGHTFDGTHPMSAVTPALERVRDVVHEFCLEHSE